MNRTVEHAKIFAPFDALKGLRGALEKREQPPAPQIELSGDRKDELDQILQNVQKGDPISVLYYEAGSYVRSTGMLVKADPASRLLQIGSVKIPLDAVIDIAMVNLSHP